MTSAHDPRLPTWLRALLAIDRAAVRAHEIEARIRDDIAWSLVPPAERASVNRAIYASASTYAPSGTLFEGGLFGWETELFERPEIPRRGRVLVGGAGGGRELRALCERGFDVTAFEPCAPLAREAAGVAARFGQRARALCGDYDDLGAAVKGHGPLASLRTAPPFDLVLLGWRSLSHVLEENERVALFAALNALAPRATIVASFLVETRPEGHGAVRRGLRAVLARVGPRVEPPKGAVFIPKAGFAVALRPGDLELLAHASARRIAWYGTAPEGVAVLVP